MKPAHLLPLLLCLVACAPGPLSRDDLWSAAGVAPDNCTEQGCVGWTPVPPETLREKLHAPAWDALDASARPRRMTQVGGWRLTVSGTPDPIRGWQLITEPVNE